MNIVKDGFILEEIKCNIKEIITNVIMDNLASYGADLSELKVEFDGANPAIIQITLPEIIANSIKRQ